ncbi:DotU family type IV/VI secretion system protein, partial [Enterobacter hormaechei]|nr:DotU family type IV/VI secretion system protein [Enterobacter hormaechei]
MSDINVDSPSLEKQSETPKTFQRQYQLPVRGESLNPMIDAATPLLGMDLRLQDMTDQALPDKLYQQVVTD